MTTLTAFPQPDSNIPAIAGEDYFRIFQQLLTPGDIFESEQSSHAIAVGPDSDISRVTCVFFDDDKDNPTRMTQAIVSPERAFVGTVNARNEAKYVPSGVRARVLFYSTDIVQPDYVPAGFDPAKDVVRVIRPVLDVIQYFTNQPSLEPQRNDKVFELSQYQWYALADDGTTSLVLPYYGRSYANITITNVAENGETIAVRLRGVDFLTEGTFGQEEMLSYTPALGYGDSLNLKVRSAVDGEFDALVISISCGTAGLVFIPLRVVMSDVPQ